MIFQNTNQPALLVFVLVCILVSDSMLLIKAIIEEKRNPSVEQEFAIVLLVLIIIIITPIVIGLAESLIIYV